MKSSQNRLRIFFKSSICISYLPYSMFQFAISYWFSCHHLSEVSIMFWQTRRTARHLQQPNTQVMSNSKHDTKLSNVTQRIWHMAYVWVRHLITVLEGGYLEHLIDYKSGSKSTMEITIVVFLVILLCSFARYQWNLLRTSSGFFYSGNGDNKFFRNATVWIISQTNSRDFYLRNPSNPFTQLHNLQHTIQICPCELAPCKILTILRKCDPFTAMSQIQLFVAQQRPAIIA
jgi:hypothetical protein